MNAFEMKDLSRKCFEKVWNDGNYDLLPDFHTTNVTFEDPNFPLPGKGIEGVKKYAKAIRTAFPDIAYKIEDQIAEGDKLVTFLRITGTQENEFLGVPATHKKATITCFTLQRFVNGKITEVYNLWDALGFMKAAGVLEKLQEPAFSHR